MNTQNKILRVLHLFSVVNCICTSFCIVMFAVPGIVAFDDSIGFSVILMSIILSSITMIIWPVYCFFQRKNNSKLRMLAIISIAVEIVLLANTYLGIVPFGDIALLLNLISPMIFNILFIVYSKQLS